MSALYDVRDAGWAPTSTQVPFDPVGPECCGKAAILKSRPIKGITEDMIEYVDRAVPTEAKEGCVLVQTTHLSMDPTHLIVSC